MKQRDYLASGIKEILATDEFSAVPIKVATPENGTVVKAGTPLTADGASTTGADAVGILLYDVDTDENPSGAAVAIGIIDADKAQEWSGINYDMGGLKASLPGIHFKTSVVQTWETFIEDTLAYDDYVSTSQPDGGQWQRGFDDSQIKVTFNGAEYICNRIYHDGFIWYYGAGDDLDYSEYPFHIESAGSESYGMTQIAVNYPQGSYDPEATFTIKIDLLRYV